MRGRRRCRLHGGRAHNHSPEMIERIRAAKIVHGGRSREVVEMLRAIRALLRVGRSFAAT